MASRLQRCVWLAAVAIVSTGCDENLLDTRVPEAGGDPRVVAVEGEQLLTQLGTGVATPIRTRVVDNDGRPIKSAVVRYVVLAGSGFFSSDSTVTDDQGFTEVTFLPTGSGTAIVEARTTRASGSASVQISVVVLSDPSEAAELIRVSGDGQSGSAASELGAPFVVRVDNPDGLGVPGYPVTFRLHSTAGPGAGVSAVRGGALSGEITVMTDGGGFARGHLKLGESPGAYTVVASALVGPSGAQTVSSTTFSATATALGPDRLEIVAGRDQTAVIDTLHQPGSPDFRGRDANPLVVRALDEFGNPVAGATITWFVSDGGGFLTSSSSTTGADGVTQNRLRGATEGRNAVVAIAAGTNGVEFVVTGVVFVEAEGGGGEGG